MLYVATRRAKRVTCRHAKDTLVARTSEEVGPGVKMEFMRSTMKDAMLAKRMRFGSWSGKAGILRLLGSFEVYNRGVWIVVEL